MTVTREEKGGGKSKNIYTEPVDKDNGVRIDWEWGWTGLGRAAGVKVGQL